MKKISIIIVSLICMISANAQTHPIYPFFDEDGAVRIETTELNDAGDTLFNMFHRADDIAWSRIVYRIIDMRYKQNYQLYFPTNYDEREYRSLFKVIVDAIIDGLEVYPKQQDDIKPRFDVDPMPKVDIPTMFLVDDPTIDYSEDADHYDIAYSDAMLIHYDSIEDVMSFHFYPYENFVKNQTKYLIQEIVFFDQRMSRMFSKIIAIAPMNADKIMSREPDQVMSAVLESVLFWIPFDALRPYLAKQYMIPEKNDNKRITFDEFFAKRLYSSYLLGDSNMYNRMIVDYTQDVETIKKEQQRIADELLNFEQDLWEY